MPVIHCSAHCLLRVGIDRLQDWHRRESNEFQFCQTFERHSNSWIVSNIFYQVFAIQSGLKRIYQQIEINSSKILHEI